MTARVGQGACPVCLGDVNVPCGSCWPRVDDREYLIPGSHSVRIVVVPPRTLSATRPRRRLERHPVAVFALALALLMVAGLALQRHWDAACAAQHPGAHWNADDWLCE